MKKTSEAKDNQTKKYNNQTYWLLIQMKLVLQFVRYWRYI